MYVCQRHFYQSTHECEHAAKSEWPVFAICAYIRCALSHWALQTTNERFLFFFPSYKCGTIFLLVSRVSKYESWISCLHVRPNAYTCPIAHKCVCVCVFWVRSSNVACLQFVCACKAKPYPRAINTMNWERKSPRREWAVSERENERILAVNWQQNRHACAQQANTRIHAHKGRELKREKKSVGLYRSLRSKDYMYETYCFFHGHRHHICKMDFSHLLQHDNYFFIERYVDEKSSLCREQSAELQPDFDIRPHWLIKNSYE